MLLNQLKIATVLVLVASGCLTAGLSWALGPKRILQAIEDKDPKTIDKVDGKAAVKLDRGVPHAADAPADGAEREQPMWIDITVRASDTGRPLAGASIRPSIDAASTLPEDLIETIRKTDGAGRARIGLFRHKSGNSFNFDVWAEGYVQQRHFFSQHDARHPKIPRAGHH